MRIMAATGFPSGGPECESTSSPDTSFIVSPMTEKMTATTWTRDFSPQRRRRDTRVERELAALHFVTQLLPGNFAGPEADAQG